MLKGFWTKPKCSHVGDWCPIVVGLHKSTISGSKFGGRSVPKGRAHHFSPGADGRMAHRAATTYHGTLGLSAARARKPYSLRRRRLSSGFRRFAIEDPAGTTRQRFLRGIPKRFLGQVFLGRPGVPRPKNHTCSGASLFFGLGSPGLQTTTWPKQTLRYPWEIPEV